MKQPRKKLFLAIATGCCTLLSSNISLAANIDKMTQNFSEPSLSAFRQIFPASFKVWSPSVKQHMLTLKYACRMRGNNVSPAITWSGIPKGSTRLHLVIEDGVCTWGCNDQGKAYHWILDFPISAMQENGPIGKNGLAEGAAKNPKLKTYTKANASGRRNYFGPCSPIGQPHAWVIQLTAYTMNNGKVKVLGKTQSAPFLFPRKELIKHKQA